MQKPKRNLLVLNMNYGCEAPNPPTYQKNTAKMTI